jgi:hypothetical protein
MPLQGQNGVGAKARFGRSLSFFRAADIATYSQEQ